MSASYLYRKSPPLLVSLKQVEIEVGYSLNLNPESCLGPSVSGAVLPIEK